jgi:hypothetical protein
MWQLKVCEWQTIFVAFYCVKYQNGRKLNLSEMEIK